MTEAGERAAGRRFAAVLAVAPLPWRRRGSPRKPRFEDVWRTARPRVWGLAARLSGSAEAAEDLAQEVGLRALAAYDSFRGDSDLNTWLYRITLNVVRRHRETARRRAECPASAVAGHDPPAPLAEQPEERLLRAERVPRVRRALDTLPDDLRVPLVLQIYEGMKCREIADVLEVPLGTVLSRLHAARNRLRSQLEEEFGDDL